MAEQEKKQDNTKFVLIIGIIILAAVVIWRIALYKSQGTIYTVDTYEHSHEPLLPENISEHVNDSNMTLTPQGSLDEVVKNARTWAPILGRWYGEIAPNFILTDINGKKHSLNDYKGKNVMLLFWATWCPPCLQEIPHLIFLRNKVSDDELAILAISDERLSKVKNFVERVKINYTVFAAAGNLPSPYNTIRAIPSTFFIDPQGRIKIVAEGATSFGEILAILRAEQ